MMKRGYSTPNLTKIEGVPDRSAVRAGMAFFSGSGPAGKTCGDCKHLDGTGRKKRAGRCLMFKKLAGRRGEEIDLRYSACKYFEAKPKPAPRVKRPAGIARTVAESDADHLRAINELLPPHLRGR
jgi:hypothetical protein